MQKYQTLLATVFDSTNLPQRWPEGLQAFLERLFQGCFQQYSHSQKGNPIDHHIEVLRNAVEIAAGADFGESEIKCITTTALVHDILTPEKKRKGDETTADEDAARKYSRADHMFRSSLHAVEAIEAANEGHFLRPREIAWVQSMTAIHDNPSAGLPLPFEPEVLAFREADRLWMISKPGFAFDLLKDLQKKLKECLRFLPFMDLPEAEGTPTSFRIPDSNVWNDFTERERYFEEARQDTKRWKVIKQLAQRRLDHIAERYKDDADLYPATLREQLREGTLFFTNAGYDLYLRKRAETAEYFDLECPPLP